MKRNVWNIKIPTLGGLLFIIVAVLATSYLVNTGVIFLGGAAPSDNPEDVRITNVTERSLSITYRTETAVIGTISIGQNKDSLQTVLDDRDQQSGIPQPYVLHTITMKNLKPSTSYVFSITSATTTYLNNGSLFQAKTGPILTTTPSDTPPVTGNVIDPNGEPPQEALVFITTKEGQTLSVLTKATGQYAIPVNTFRTQDFQTPKELTPDTTFQILVTDGTDSSQAMMNLSGANPVPLITLSNNYNFLTATTPLATSSAQDIGFPAFAADSTLTATPEIITPKKDESFSDAQPEFSGKALPNESVSIEIHSNDAINATITSDASGNWSYRPNQALTPGNHTISITTKNTAGILQTIEQSFTVYAEGTQLAQVPSPTTSPTQGVTPSPTNKPTASPTLSPTNVPTVVTPTVAPTVRPTTIPTQIPTKITPVPTLPATGSNSLVVVGVTSIVTTAVGIVLFFLTNTASAL